jgi:hypothetical protein
MYATESACPLELGARPLWYGLCIAPVLHVRLLEVLASSVWYSADAIRAIPVR